MLRKSRKRPFGDVFNKNNYLKSLFFSGDFLTYFSTHTANATVILTEKAFREPESYYNLENIDAKGVKDIERYLEGTSQVPPTASTIEVRLLSPRIYH